MPVFVSLQEQEKPGCFFKFFAGELHGFQVRSRNNGTVIGQQYRVMVRGDTCDDFSQPFIAGRIERNKPDGACVDAEGGLWVAVIGGSRIDRFHPDGQFDQSFPVPVSRPTMPMFGGPDLRQLFVTSQRRFLSAAELARQPAAGSLLMAEAGIAGLPPNRANL